jgi:hypothetical protein
MITTLFLEGLLQGRHESLVTSSQRANTDYMDIIVDSLPSHFLGGLEKATHVYIETEISEA